MNTPSTTNELEPRRRRSGAWMLVAGCLMAAFGYALEPVQDGGGGGVGGQLPQITLTPPVLGMADSNNRMIAVTGVDLTGQAILFLIDTVDPHIAVYQASGGSAGTQGIRLVAARRTDLDLQLNGFNDRSEFKYDELEERFAAGGLLDD
jgi:hypothetical protein